MKLADFDSDEEIYVDANIFIYTMLKNPKYFASCKSFLERVEKGEVNAAVSPLVLDEVCFKIIIETLKAKYDIESGAVIIERIKKNPKMLNEAKSELMTFLFIIENYKGLKIVSARSATGMRMVENIVNRDLLPRDALHLAIMDFYDVKHIATADSDFERVKEINVWKP